jgi:hypothetical protein
MTEAHPRVAILMLSHVLHDEALGLFREIKAACGDHYKVVFLGDNSHHTFDAFQGDEDFFLFDVDALLSLGYPGRPLAFGADARVKDPEHMDFNFEPGSTDMPMQYWWQRNPGYDFCWVVEYDVRYTGSWRQFFAAFEGNDADLIGTWLTRYRDIPDWHHWHSLNLLDDTLRIEDYVRGFFPVYRLSGRAFALLDSEYRRGISGHYEGVVPTLLDRAGLRMEDIGGDGEFVRPENRNRYYRDGSFTYRPIRYSTGSEADTLWHPVKPVPTWEEIRHHLREFVEGQRGG